MSLTASRACLRPANPCLADMAVRPGRSVSSKGTVLIRIVRLWYGGAESADDRPLFSYKEGVGRHAGLQKMLWIFQADLYGEHHMHAFFLGLHVLRCELSL